jgi:hypothetical protein
MGHIGTDLAPPGGYLGRKPMFFMDIGYQAPLKSSKQRGYG